MSARPEGVEAGYPLARLTTVRTGGPADWFATAEDAERLTGLLAWARDEELPVGVVGSGSNLLVADDGFRGLVLKLGGDLASMEADGQTLVCGGGARFPQASALAARLGLTGIEFGVSIPGTVGGAVKMNANAYGGDLSRVLEWGEIARAEGVDRRTPDVLGVEYRRAEPGPGGGGGRAPLAPPPPPPGGAEREPA